MFTLCEFDMLATRRLILQIMRKHNGTRLTSREIADLSGLSVATVWRAMPDLVAANQLKMVEPKRGPIPPLYEVVNNG